MTHIDLLDHLWRGFWRK